MKPVALLAIGLAIAGTATFTLAQSSPPGTGKTPRHTKIDTNGDGAIDRSEAAAHPRMAEQFDKLDANKDGRITADERPQHGMRDGKGGPGGHMAKIDTNGDGAIDRSEAAAHPRMAEQFDKLDANKDGRITADERPQRGMRDGKGGPGGHMAKIDTNGDGAIDRSEAAAHPRMAEQFDKLDANKDGRITADERPQHGMRDGKGGGMRDGKGGRGGQMLQLDTDKDGRFSRAELAGRERMLQNFSAIDANKDGFLTHEEMQAFHRQNRPGNPGQAKP
jgi:uncharacterized protein (DUF2249 family)